MVFQRVCVCCAYGPSVIQDAPTIGLFVFV